jgi:hypothetical protein
VERLAERDAEREDDGNRQGDQSPPPQLGLSTTATTLAPLDGRQRQADASG